MKNDILYQVDEYYSGKIMQYGATNLGVDWSSAESQRLRFEQITRVIAETNKEDRFTICDYGCGYGALYEFLKDAGYKNFDYYGIDVSAHMIKEGEQRYGENSNAHFIHGSDICDCYDYVVTSGIFNVKYDRTDEEWMEYFVSVIDMMNEKSSKGISFNCLTMYSDTEKMKDNLFYPDPCYFFDYCKRNYSKNVALLHDYGIYEFTILVRK